MWEKRFPVEISATAPWKVNYKQGFTSTKAHGTVFLQPTNIPHASEAVHLPSHLEPLGKLQIYSYAQVKGHERCSTEWGWSVRLHGTVLNMVLIPCSAAQS